MTFRSACVLFPLLVNLRQARFVCLALNNVAIDVLRLAYTDDLCDFNDCLLVFVPPLREASVIISAHYYVFYLVFTIINLCLPSWKEFVTTRLLKYLTFVMRFFLFSARIKTALLEESPSVY